MDTYSLMREFADSWVLLVLTLFFVGVFVWAFRPGSRPVHDKIARSIFEHDRCPAPETEIAGMTRRPSKEA